MLYQRKFQILSTNTGMSVIFFIFIFLLSSTVYAQKSWQKVESGTTKDLLSVAQYGDLIIAIGNRVCLRSTNDGKTWESITFSGLSFSVFNDVSFSSDGRIHAVGNGSARYYSGDDGENWTAYPGSSSDALYSVSFPYHVVNLDYVGIAVGSSGRVYRTTDNGATWDSPFGPTSEDLNAVYFWQSKSAKEPDPFTGIVVGDNGEIYLTNDLGENWAKKNSGTTSDLNGIYFGNADMFVCGNDGIILKSTDRGETWNDVSPDGISTNFTSMVVANIDGNWVVGNGGAIMTTSDGGSTWTPVESGTESNLRSVISTGLNTSIAVGDDGTILRHDVLQRTFWGDAPATVPGKIEAEEYDIGANGTAYYDLSSGNEGGVFRDDDVDIQECSDVGGGYNVGWTENGEWLEYTFNSAESGTFTVSARVASGLSDNSFSIQIDGEQTLNATIQNTGGWQTWQNKTLGQVQLSQGQHVLRVNTLGGSINYNYFEISQGVTALNSTEELPQEFSLEQNYPNPFNPATTIEYTVATYRNTPQHVNLSIYDLLGRKVATLVDKEMMPGAHSVLFNAGNLPSGVYLYRLQAGAYKQTRKLMLVK